MRAVAGRRTAGRTFANPVIAGAPGEDHGDPFVIKYLDSFYLYHSGETAGRRGVSVHRSENLLDWEFCGYALEPAESGWAYSDLWAPEVVYERGVFYMYVSAARKRRGGRPTQWQQGEGDDRGRRIGVARATSPLGPFVLDDEPLLDVWSIDAHPFRDDDGTMWLFYNVRTQDLRVPDALPGTGLVCDRLLAPDRVEGNPSVVVLPSEAWEGVGSGDWYWNEGPYVLKRRGRYHLFYSGGAFSDASYAVGLADARHVRGPWRKNPANPVVRSTDAIGGPGHQSFVFGPDAATRYAVYHGYVDGDAGRKVLLDRAYWTGDGPLIDGPTAALQLAPARASHDEAVRHWRAEAWARGTWVVVGGTRFALDLPEVWHQVEAVQVDGRFTVRVGGVLRASRPGVSEPRFESDGEVAFETVTSTLQDEGVHHLPRGSEYAWEWGGADRIEVSLGVRGFVELAFDERTHLLEGDPESFRLVTLNHDQPVRQIVAKAGDEAAAVADLSVYDRSDA